MTSNSFHWYSISHQSFFYYNNKTTLHMTLHYNELEYLQLHVHVYYLTIIVHNYKFDTTLSHYLSISYTHTPTYNFPLSFLPTLYSLSLSITPSLVSSSAPPPSTPICLPIPFLPTPSFPLSFPLSSYSSFSSSSSSCV